MPSGKFGSEMLGGSRIGFVLTRCFSGWRRLLTLSHMRRKLLENLHFPTGIVLLRIDARCALAIMDCVPENDRSTTWQRLVSTVRNCDPLSQYRDLEDIRKKSGPSTTAREAMTQARIGQGAFRRELEARWGSRCAVTGIGIRETLIASHIKDWKSSSINERLDKNNGLFPAAHIDALFDKGLISFDDCGYMLVSQRVSKSERKRLGIPKPLRCKLCNGEREYLSIHRRNQGFASRSKARSP